MVAILPGGLGVSSTSKPIALGTIKILVWSQLSLRCLVTLVNIARYLEECVLIRRLPMALFTRAVFQATRLQYMMRHLRMFSYGLQRTTTDKSNLDDKPCEQETFADMFKHSKFATMLDPINQKVKGEVLAVVEDKMYIDFGCKFHAVVPVPKERVASYRKGTPVIVRVLDLEMTSHFIGDHRDLTLLEAEAELFDE